MVQPFYQSRATLPAAHQHPHVFTQSSEIDIHGGCLQWGHLVYFLQIHFQIRFQSSTPPSFSKSCFQVQKTQHKPNFTSNSLTQYLFHQNSSGFVLKFSLGMRTCESVIRFFCLHKLYFLTGYWRINICIENSKHIGTHISNTFI